MTARRGGPDVEELLPLLAAVALFGGLGAVVAVAHLGRWLSGGGEELPGNPFDLATGLLFGDVAWPDRSGQAAALLAVPLLALAAAVPVLRSRGRGKRTRVYSAARHMASGADLEPVAAKRAQAKADRLGYGAHGPGVPIGVTVAGGRRLFQDWEAVAVIIMGPRTGKTTSQVVPAILAAPGWVVTTSNKPDSTVDTRHVRAQAGEVHVFDPQQLVGEPAGRLWWNPLSYVTDESKARALARVFTVAQREPGAKTDAYFDPAGQTLLANFLHAAAIANEPITRVYEWLTRPNNPEPAEILAEAGFGLQAGAVQGIVDLHEKQRGGVYGTAEQTMAWLTSRRAQAWVTPRPGAAEFDQHAFVRSADTLYLLSKEGEGSTGPLTTALTVAVCEAAEAYARTSPGGRLPVPGAVLLDETANICRWADLPGLYSHYGSRGIVMQTVLQSYSQGVGVWGRDGMRALTSAANVLLVGGGVREPEFLRELSALVGEYETTKTSMSYSRSGRSSSRSTERRPVLDVSRLGVLPAGRAVAFFSGAPPALLRLVPWWEGEHRALVEESKAAHEPVAGFTAAEAAAALAEPADVPAAGAGNPWTQGSWR